MIPVEGVCKHGGIVELLLRSGRERMARVKTVCVCVYVCMYVCMDLERRMPCRLYVRNVIYVPVLNMSKGCVYAPILYTKHVRDFVYAQNT